MGRNVTKSEKIFERNRIRKKGKVSSMTTTKTISNYNVVLIMVLTIKQQWANHHLPNAADDGFQQLCLLCF